MKMYRVAGLTCGHCVKSVNEEVGAIEGVTAVQTDLTTGELQVEGENFTDEQVSAAVEEAGYSLV